MAPRLSRAISSFEVSLKLCQRENWYRDSIDVVTMQIAKFQPDPYTMNHLEGH
jgi:hypothetical protein